MKVVIFSGGTGSIALQTGIQRLFGGYIQPTVVINAYDNGLSTGAVRRVLNGKILGPSDLRKNQILQAKLRGTCRTEMLNYLNLRVSATDSQDMKNQILGSIPDGSSKGEVDLINEALNAYFDEPDSEIITYDDFSISNIIYAGIAKICDYSLEGAGIEIGQKLLGLPADSVMLVSDDSLFLQAITKNGDIILDEGDIVSWGNEDNPIIDIKLVDIENKSRVPEVSPTVLEKIEEADLIIFSSGTLWSSLIPTYYHKGFREAIKASKASKYIIMNNIQDEDMTGINASKIQRILDKYLPMKDIITVFNKQAQNSMRRGDSGFKGLYGDLNPTLIESQDISTNEPIYSKTHEAEPLAKFIIGDFLGKYTDFKNHLMFDFDDTLVGRNNSFKVESIANLMGISAIAKKRKVSIVTGNSLKHVNESISKLILNLDTFKTPEFVVYSDGGNSFCTWNEEKEKFVFSKYVNGSYVLGQKEVEEITNTILSKKVPVNKIENRNNVIISIKPLERQERENIARGLRTSLGNNFEVHMTGRTTIDIYKKGYSKAVVLEWIKGPVTYIGDELEKGNDSVMVNKKGIICYSVDNPKDTLNFLKILY